MKQKLKIWTSEEESLLKSIGSVTDIALLVAMFGTTKHALYKKMERLEICRHNKTMQHSTPMIVLLPASNYDEYKNLVNNYRLQSITQEQAIDKQ